MAILLESGSSLLLESGSVLLLESDGGGGGGSITIADYNQSTFGTAISSGANITAGSVAWQTGDIIVVLGGVEQGAGTISLGTPSVAGLTFTAIDAAAGTTANDCWGRSWSATAASSGSGAIACTVTGGSSVHCGIHVWVIRNHSGIGVHSCSVTGATNTTSLTTAASSVVVEAMFDWSAGAAGVAGTPTSPTPTERIDGASTQWAYWGGDWAGVSAGAQSFGVTGASSRHWTTVAVEILAGGGSPATQTTTAQVGTITLSGVAGVSNFGAVTTTAQAATLVLSGVAGVSNFGAVTTTAQVATITLSGVAGTSSVSGSTQTTTAQIATVTLTGVQGTSSVGTVTTTAQVATLALTGVAGSSSFGPVTTVAQVATLALSGVAGSSSFGPVTTVAQIGTIVLTGVPGSSSISGGSTQTTTAQVGTLTVTGVPGVSSFGAVVTVAQAAQLTLLGVAGSSSFGPVTTTAQPGTLTLTGVPGVSSVVVSGAAIPGRITAWFETPSSAYLEPGALRTAEPVAVASADRPGTNWNEPAPSEGVTV